MSFNQAFQNSNRLASSVYHNRKFSERILYTPAIFKAMPRLHRLTGRLWLSKLTSLFQHFLSDLKTSLLNSAFAVSSHSTRGDFRDKYKWMHESSFTLNCGERYQDMIDHRSYIAHNLSSCEIKACKKFRPEPRDLDHWPLRDWCSSLPTKLSSQLGACYVNVVRS